LIHIDTMLDYVNILQTQSRFCHLSSLAWHWFCSLGKRLASRLNGLWAIYKSLKVLFSIKLKIIVVEHYFLLYQTPKDILRRNKRSIGQVYFLFLDLFQEFLVVTHAQFNFMLILSDFFFFFFFKKNHHFLIYYLFYVLRSIYQLVCISKFKFHWIIATETNH